MLIDNCISVWVYIENWIGMNLDLDNIPRRTESLLGEPKSGKFENDIAHFTGLYRLKVDDLLLCIEHLGRLDTIACELTINYTGGVGTLDDRIRELLTEPRLTVLVRRLEVSRVDILDLLEVSLGREVKNNFPDTSATFTLLS